MSAAEWYAVKCLFNHPTRVSEGESYLYEERTTLWRASSWHEAFAMAEAEAAEYARKETCEFVRASDSFHLYESEIGHGSEIWSQMRGSNMAPEVFIATFCCTARDRVSYLSDDSGTDEASVKKQD